MIDIWMRVGLMVPEGTSLLRAVGSLQGVADFLNRAHPAVGLGMQDDTGRQTIFFKDIPGIEIHIFFCLFDWIKKRKPR